MKKLVLALLLLASPAFADDGTRKFDFTQLLTGPDKKPFRECAEIDKTDPRKCASEVDITLGYLSANALSLHKQGQSDSTRRGRLAYRIYDAKDAELSPTEITLILNALDDMPNVRNTMIYAAKRLLSPKDADGDK
jgi:hypothetical protein